MSGIRLRMLGPVQVERHGEPLRGFESQKALALLCYLVAQGRPVPRGSLVGLFWGEKPEARALGNLRRVLHNLTGLLPGRLAADRYAVECRLAAADWLDVAAFDELEARGDPAALAEAAALYRGEFMEGVSLGDSPEFETWLVAEREHYRQRVAHGLNRLAACHLDRGEFEQGLNCASRLLSLDSWREEAHRLTMLLLARCGQRGAALAQFEACRRVLAEELGVEPAAETVRLYERIRTATAIASPGLPPQPTPFVGRKAELADVAGLLAKPDCRLLTLVGPGGAGKTRLALRLASQKSGEFLHGVYLVPLARAPSAGSLIPLLADALRFSFSGREDPKAQLLNYLREKEMLLVLDGFEHLLGASAAASELLVEILEGGPDVKLLVTSRERLRLRWEWLFEVQGLEYPRDDGRPAGPTDGGAEDEAPSATLRPWDGYSAVELFLQTARRVRPHFTPSEDEAPFVVRICRLVDGLPLGIELAAAWVESLPPQQIAEGIERNHDFLTTWLRDVPERQRSLRAVFEHSWRLLSEAERTAFQRASAFRGGFTAEAAEAVLGEDCRVTKVEAARPSLAARHPRPLPLSALVDKSLLRRGPAGRYEMHELLRQFAEERLEGLPAESEAAHDGHCDYYAELLHRQEPHLQGDGGAGALEAIAAEIQNVRAAWQ